MFHSFSTDISTIVLPERFTCPFCYNPHILTIRASREVQEYIRSRSDWKEELSHGKMFGVLVVKDSNGKVGYLASFSGQIQGRNLHRYFVPPVYDLVAENSFFKCEESIISNINAEIVRLKDSPVFKEYEILFRTVEKKLEERKSILKVMKQARDVRREHSVSADELSAMIRESQFQKAEFKRLKSSLMLELQQVQDKCNSVHNEIIALSEKRRRLSSDLQKKIFRYFVFRNAKGEERNALEIFDDRLPPAGAGECAGPRLLQYAYCSGYIPIAMAEFWWGASPSKEIRRQGNFYPACHHKCEPILNFMLQGLDVEENRFSQEYDLSEYISVIYEDECVIVVNKPADMLSVPGNIPQPSVYNWVCNRCGETYIVHRLDMATSGILMFAKTKQACAYIQQQFEKRTVNKEYVAILDGTVKNVKGCISLPLSPYKEEPPLQIVDKENGKEAITEYVVIDCMNGRTKVRFCPITGRTHQLRVHAASPYGLDCPIVGDVLYGKFDDRLYLHAEKLSFEHPLYKKTMTFFCPAPF